MDQLGIGAALTRAREARKLTIEAAAEATRIRARYLEALEHEDFAALPAPVFATGLLRTYASFLKLDPNELAARMATLPAMRPPVTVVPEVGEFRPGESIAPRLLVGALVVLVSGLLLYYLYSQYTAFVAGERGVQVVVTAAPASPSPQSLLPTPTVGVGIVPAGTSVVVRATVTPTRSPAPQATTEPTSPAPAPMRTVEPSPTASEWVVIQALFVDRVWAQIEVDDKLVASKTFNAGERAEWRGKKVFLWTGNAAGVEVTYNGKSLGKLGARGELVRVTWTAR